MGRLGVRLTNEEYDKLEEGVIAPDKWRDYPHHYGKSEKIKEYLNKARACYLQNDLPSAYFNLGVALHYIQDSYTTYPSSLPKHQEWEEWIENSYLGSSFEAIQTTIRNEHTRNRCCWLDQELSRKFQGRENTLKTATLNGQMKEPSSIASPKVDFYLGFWASYVVSKSILSPKECPYLDLQLENLHSIHVNDMKLAEVESANKVRRLVMEKDALSATIIQSKGIVPRIRNWITSFRIGSKDRGLISSKNAYFNRDHLTNVKTRYNGQNKTNYSRLCWMV